MQGLIEIKIMLKNNCKCAKKYFEIRKLKKIMLYKEMLTDGATIKSFEK